jgi:lysophospholipase L1-like esterase
MKNNTKRSLAVLFGIGLLICAEILLRFVGFAPLSRQEWSKTHGVYSIERYFAQAVNHFEQKNEGKCQTNSLLNRGLNSTEQAMQPQNFPCLPQGSRIVTMGGASVQGYGLPLGFSFASEVERMLKESNRPWDVINAGVAGYNTLQLRRMLPEIWSLEPSVIILYAGHNDFVYYPMIEEVLQSSKVQLQMRKWGDYSALWQFIRATLITQPALISQEITRPSFAKQAKTAFNQLPLPIPKNSLELQQIRKDQSKALSNIKNFYKENVQYIIDEAKKRNIKLLLVVPVSRLDSPPMDGIHWTDLSDEQLQYWQELWTELEQDIPQWDDPRWEELLSLDEEYAPAAHLAAQQAWKAKDKEAAIRLWAIAQEKSPPSRTIRMPNSFGDWIVQIGRAKNVDVVDLRPIWKQVAKEKGVAAGDLFLDALHLNEQGTILLSEVVLMHLKENRWLESGDGNE